MGRLNRTPEKGDVCKPAGSPLLDATRISFPAFPRCAARPPTRVKSLLFFGRRRRCAPSMKAAQLLLLTIALAETGSVPQTPRRLKVRSFDRQRLEGSGFVVRHDGKFFGVALLHQFGGKTPSKLYPLEGDPVLLDTTRVLKQKDVQALPVTTVPFKLQFLAYHAEFVLRPGDAVIILGPAGDVVPGTLTAKGINGTCQTSDGPRELEARTSKPLMMAGGSGGPVIHAQSGTVIGVLLTADDAKQARPVGFEILCFSKLR